MTHEELLAKLWILPADTTELQHGAKAIQALRAVVELHKPLQGLVNEPFTCQACRFTIGNPVYPCPTIQAIEKYLKL